MAKHTLAYMKRHPKKFTKEEIEDEALVEEAVKEDTQIGFDPDLPENKQREYR